MHNKRITALLVSLLSLAGCGGGGGGDAVTAPIVPGPTNSSPAPAPVPAPAVPSNATPVANAGAQQSVLAGAVVTADASASSDADNNPLTYTWAITSKPANSAATLTSATSPKPNFIADIAGDYVLSLVVNDGKVDSSPATMKVTAAVVNAAPVGNAGAAQSTVTGQLVTLDGSGSSDANGDTLTYSWVLTPSNRQHGECFQSHQYEAHVCPRYCRDLHR